MGRIGQASVLRPAAAYKGLLQVPRWTTLHLEVQPHPRVAQSLQIAISDADKSHVRVTFAGSQARTRGAYLELSTFTCSSQCPPSFPPQLPTWKTGLARRCYLGI